MASPKRERHVSPDEFARLFHLIARVSLISGMSACASETDTPPAGAFRQDAGNAADGATEAPNDGGADARVPGDGAAPGDAGAPEDGATPGDAGLAYEPVPCVDGTVELGPPLTTTSPVDSLAIYTSASGGFLPDDRPSYYRVLAYGGDPCADAADKVVCEGALSAAQFAAPCETQSAPECDMISVYARDGVFTRILTRESLFTFLGGSVDSVSAALLLAAFDGHTVTCSPAFTTEQGLKGTRAVRVGTDVYVETEWEDCGAGKFRERYVVRADGTLGESERETLGASQCAIGRRPNGLCAGAGATGTSALARYLAEACELEAASVHAFQELGEELSALGAPEALCRQAEAALCDEVLHTRTMARLARVHGGAPELPRVSAYAQRGACALARDNATEGCVRETYGALLATYQAQAAEDEALRAAFADIAADETRHAQLSWRIHAWLAPQLTSAQRAEVDRAREAAIAELRAEVVHTSLDDAERAALGLPPPQVARAMLDQLSRTLWA